MNYLADPCNDREVKDVPLPIHSKEPVSDTTIFGREMNRDKKFSQKGGEYP